MRGRSGQAVSLIPTGRRGGGIGPKESHRAGAAGDGGRTAGAYGPVAGGAGPGTGAEERREAIEVREVTGQPGDTGTRWAPRPGRPRDPGTGLHPGE